MSKNVHKNYNEVLPTRFSAIESFSDWISKLPDDSVSSGEAHLFQDGRIEWFIQQCGSIKDFKIMELGPFEGGHTYMLHQHQPKFIDAIEAKKDFYLKCLCVKEAFNLHSAHFFLGSFVDWLKQPNKSYDLIVASGVLYHMTDPVGLLDLLSKRTARLCLWTHYAPEKPYPEDHPLRAAYAGTELMEYKGITVKLHKRTYLDASGNPAFCGGVRDDHSWLEREAIIQILKQNGFNRIETIDQENHPNGPCFSLYAEKQ